jgi:hypothetical protein
MITNTAKTAAPIAVASAPIAVIPAVSTAAEAKPVPRTDKPVTAPSFCFLFKVFIVFFLKDKLPKLAVFALRRLIAI